MSLITVHELLTWENTSHEWTESDLFGTLFVVTTETEYPRGTLLLKDAITDTCFPCHINYFHPRLLQTNIIIKRWHLIYQQQDLAWIEFSATDSYFINQDQSALEACLDVDRVLFEVSSRSLLYTSSTTHRIGRVESVSPLYAIKPDEPAIFLIQLKQGRETIDLMFQGDDCIPYYAMFHVNLLCAFQHLTYSPTLAVFLFKPNTSACQVIPQSIPSSLIPPTKTPSLSGTITRVFDPMFGLYEVDHRFLLSLFHSPKYSPAQPLRVQTRIRLYQIHSVSLQLDLQEGFTSYFLDGLLKACPSHDTLAHYPCLVGCPKTDLEILSFPTHCDWVPLTRPLLEDQLKCHVYLDSLSDQVSFGDLIRRLEIYASLITLFPKQPVEQLKNVYDRLKGSANPRTPCDWKTQWRDHQPCIAGLSPLERKQREVVTVENYTSFSQLLAYHQANQNTPQPYTLSLSGASDRFEIDHVYTEAMEFVPKDLFLLVQLKISSDGRVHLVETDSDSRILLLAPFEITLDGFYLIRQAHWIREDLSYLSTNQQTEASRQELWHEHLVCPEPDSIQLLSSARACAQLAFHIANPHLFGPMQLTEQDLPTPLTRLCVTRVFPIQACFDAEGRLYLESRLLVKCAPVDPVETEVKECILVLSSKAQSLQFHSLLIMDSQWIIHGSLQGDASTLLQAAHRRRPVIVLNSQHCLYPVVSSLDYPGRRLVSLVPRHSETLTPTTVYQISQLVNAKSIPVKTVLMNGLYEQMVNIEGVVLLKRFVDGFGDSSLDEHALSLYQNLGLGTGKPRRKLFVQLRQANSLDLVEIYLDVHKLHYPLGLIVGATVIFYNLTRKTRQTASGGSFFCLANESTTIRMTKLMPDRDTLLLPPNSIKTEPLIHFYRKDNDDEEDEEKKKSMKKGVKRLLCQVNSVIHLVLKWECNDCGSIVQHDECYRMCQNAHRVFIANAFVEISDGTAAANASLDGERLVFQLLQLTTKQRDALKRAILDYGMVSFHGWANAGQTLTVNGEGEYSDFIPPDQEQRKAMFGYTIDDLVQRAKKAGQFWMYGVIQPSIPYQGNDASNHRINLSDHGSLVRIIERTKVRFKIIELELADARLVAYDLLNQLL
ncbi:CST, telomere maintenance, complex subunit CTC1-domain-containing protein [Blakeslea trispora]|nr:CST, telomere maintenance, complex subunit CTC1-domain-containing protein [Blakeslea trispora]